jgi:GTPase SAR1 family protein
MWSLMVRICARLVAGMQFATIRMTFSTPVVVSLAKPQVLLVGQYSVGKTSFIRYLLGRDFPGQRIGPEPTTDRFTVLLNGPEERTIPGNALSGTCISIHC